MKWKQNLVEAEGKEDSEEDESHQVKGERIFTVDGKILTEKLVLSQIRLREHKIDFLKRKLELYKMNLQKRKQSSSEDKENLGDEDTEWALDIRSEESKRHLAFRLEEHWAAQRQQREFLEESAQDKDVENIDLGFSNADVEEEEGRRESALGPFLVASAQGNADQVETAEALTGQIYMPE